MGRFRNSFEKVLVAFGPDKLPISTKNQLYETMLLSFGEFDKVGLKNGSVFLMDVLARHEVFPSADWLDGIQDGVFKSMVRETILARYAPSKPSLLRPRI